MVMVGVLIVVQQETLRVWSIKLIALMRGER